MPSINRSHDEFALIAATIRQTLRADELLGLLAAHGLPIEITELSPEIRQELAALADDFDAIAQEHADDTALNDTASNLMLAERLHVLIEVQRFLERARDLDEARAWVGLNAKLIEAVADQ